MKTYVFPGQGSQRKGMGDSLFDDFPHEVAIADAVLGYSIKQLCLDDPDGKLDSTEFTQPALYVVNALSWLKKLAEGAQADYFAGHSLGEFNALSAAGAFSFETGLRLVKKRGELMARARGGAMAAVLNCPVDDIRRILATNSISSIDLANFNTRSQTVISGPAADINAVQSLFQTDAYLFVPLKTSASFHSRYMEPARADFAAFLAEIDLEEPLVPVLSNVTARPYGPGQVKDLLAQQIVSAVRWTDTVEHLLGREGMIFEEVGHGDVLTKLIAKIRRDLPQPAATPAPEISAEELVARWNTDHPVGTRVKSTTSDLEMLETATPATVLFGHRAAVYMTGYRGYFDLNEIQPIR